MLYEIKYQHHCGFYFMILQDCEYVTKSVPLSIPSAIDFSFAVNGCEE